MPASVEAIVLGLVQGLTEFLPVSSSGHLVVVPALAGWNEPSLTFDLVLHAGTLAAVAFYFRSDLLGLARSLVNRGEDADRSRRLLWLLAVATVPAGAAGLAFGDFFEDLFDEALWATAFWGVTAVILVGGEAVHRRAAPRAIGFREAVVIGVAQAAAITPGISRAGATIAVAIALGVSRSDATRFSFLLSIPAITGAVLTAVPDLTGGEFEVTGAVAAGFAVSLFSGYAAVAGLLALVRNRTLLPFAAYLAVLAPAAAVAL